MLICNDKWNKETAVKLSHALNVLICNKKSTEPDSIVELKPMVSATPEAIDSFRDLVVITDSELSAATNFASDQINNPDSLASFFAYLSKARQITYNLPLLPIELKGYDLTNIDTFAKHAFSLISSFYDDSKYHLTETATYQTRIGSMRDILKRLAISISQAEAGDNTDDIKLICNYLNKIASLLNTFYFLPSQRRALTL